MKNLKKYEITNLNEVIGGTKPKAKVTVKITGVLDGIKHNTKVTIDGEIS